jgi:hypothetical protein
MTSQLQGNPQPFAATPSVACVTYKVKTTDPAAVSFLCPPAARTKPAIHEYH